MGRRQQAAPARARFHGPAAPALSSRQRLLRLRIDALWLARTPGDSAQAGPVIDRPVRGASATSAAGLLAPVASELFAFTAVPGSAGGSSHGRIDDEGPLAAATAARYANITHIPIVAPQVSPLDFLDRDLLLNEQIVTNI